MAAFQGIAQTTEVALSAATAKTVVQIAAPANHRLKVLRVGFFFDGTSTTAEPVQVTLSRQSSSGTMSALTPVPLDDSLSETLQTLAQFNASAEPTTGATIDSCECHPQQGFEVIYPLGQEPIVGGGDKVGLVCTAPASVNVRGKLVFEE